LHDLPLGLQEGQALQGQNRPDHVFAHPLGTAAKIPQEPALELEEEAQHPGDREDDLAVWNIEEERLPHPLDPLLQPLGMARRAKPSGLAGKREQMFRPAARAPDPGKAATRIAAVETSLRGAKRRGNLMPFARHFEITTAFQAS
jgi:hypothetical protein